MDTDFVLLGNSKSNVGSLAIDETENDNNFISFIAQTWGLD